VHDADEPTDDPEVGVTRLPVPIPGAPVETGKPRLTGASGERTTGLEPATSAWERLQDRLERPV
jgi:hypothetical protein